MSAEFNNISFDLPKNQSNVIKVIGVGGGGSNAVNHMFKKGIDHKIIPFEGESLVATFDSNSQHPRTIYFEHIGNRGMREGDWKLVSLTKNIFPYHKEWELYNLKKDRSETINLALKYPEKVKELETKWNVWAERTNVLPLDGRGWNKRIADPTGVQKVE